MHKLFQQLKAEWSLLSVSPKNRKLRYLLGMCAYVLPLSLPLVLFYAFLPALLDIFFFLFAGRQFYYFEGQIYSGIDLNTLLALTRDYLQTDRFGAIATSLAGLLYLLGIAGKIIEQRERRRIAQEHQALQQGLKVRFLLAGHKQYVNRLRWSPDGERLASPGDDKTIRIWNTTTGHALLTLAGHTRAVTDVCWSPDGRLLASASRDHTIRLWDTQTGQVLQTLPAHTQRVEAVDWSPDGRLLASASPDRTVRIRDTHTWQLLYTLTGHTREVRDVCWSPDGRLLASASLDRTVRVWDAHTWQPLSTLPGHTLGVEAVDWSPDGLMLASASLDKTVRIWNPRTGKLTAILEGHTDRVLQVDFSSDNSFLASKSHEAIRFWRTDTWETTAILEIPIGEYVRFSGALDFHPRTHALATVGQQNTIVCIWDVESTTLLAASPVPSVHYTNAKVVLMGDTGVGKSGLALILTGQPFAPTESTHARHVWNLDHAEIETRRGHKEIREILLWDLAGQPGYRLIHQLALREVAIALIVFDAHNETDPFAGVHYWNNVLSQVQQMQDGALPAPKKFLVAARVDRGGIGVSSDRTRSLVRDLGFDRFFATSARYQQNTAELAREIRDLIAWEALPQVNSTVLFQEIKHALMAEKMHGRLLATMDDLYRICLARLAQRWRDLQAQFTTCVELLEARDLLRRLSFGNLILLQPELLDAYASSLVNAVKDEPDGFGSIDEERVRAGDFFIPGEQRLKNAELEKLLLIAMIEDLLRYDIVLREATDKGTYLVFPSQSTREHPDLPDPQGKAVAFSFAGSILHIYTTLAVRLANSGFFKKKDLWKNAVTYTAGGKATYGMFLQDSGMGHAELTLFFDTETSQQLRVSFEEYIQAHLQSRALPHTVHKRHIYICQHCSTPFNELQIKRRQELGVDSITCSVCEQKMALLPGIQPRAGASLHVIQDIDQAANAQRDRETAKSILQGKVKAHDFDVFLCHNVADKPEVKKIGEQLKEHGILPWLDEWELRPGFPWQHALERNIKHIKSAAVFVGRQGIGPWQDMEVRAFLREFLKRECPVIPVILPACDTSPNLPIFLDGLTWVDFRPQEADPDVDPMDRLIWGVTGKHASEW